MNKAHLRFGFSLLYELEVQKARSMLRWKKTKCMRELSTANMIPENREIIRSAGSQEVRMFFPEFLKIFTQIIHGLDNFQPWKIIA